MQLPGCLVSQGGRRLDPERMVAVEAESRRRRTDRSRDGAARKCQAQHVQCGKMQEHTQLPCPCLRRAGSSGWLAAPPRGVSSIRSTMICPSSDALTTPPSISFSTSLRCCSSCSCGSAVRVGAQAHDDVFFARVRIDPQPDRHLRHDRPRLLFSTSAASVFASITFCSSSRSRSVSIIARCSRRSRCAASAFLQNLADARSSALHLLGESRAAARC